MMTMMIVMTMMTTQVLIMVTIIYRKRTRTKEGQDRKSEKMNLESLRS